MVADRDILDQIDDVIAWHGSRDAMVWTADAPKPPIPPTAGIDPEVARQFAESMGRQAQAFVDAFRPVAEQMMRTVGEICQAFAGIINTPEMQELVQEQRRARSAMKSEYARRSRRRARR